MKNLKLTLLALATVGMIALSACKKEDKGQTGNMTVQMVDAPGDFKEVNVEVTGVEIHYDDGDTINGWVSLPTKAGIYDLLTLQDSVTALLATGTNLRVGKVTQMRLLLGSNNTIVIDSVGTYPLVVPSGQQSGIKIKINENIPVNRDLMITLDFDAEKSIVKTGNDKYMLKPVIFVKEAKVL